jgi:Phage related hypothetical protein (DUF1799)
MRGMGAPDPVIDAARKQWEARQEERTLIEVYPENIQAFRILQATGGQWEMPGAFGGRCALPLTEIEACMRLLQIQVTQDLSLRVMTMVHSARKVFLERIDRERSS